MNKKIMLTLSASIVCGGLAMATESIPADTNRDGRGTTDDAALIYDYILGRANFNVVADMVDVNRDGEVNTADVVEVYNAIKNTPPPPEG